MKLNYPNVDRNRTNDLSMIGMKKIEEKTKEEPINFDEEEVEEINLEYIIEHKPKPKIVREFMKANLESIIGDEESVFHK